MKVKALKPFVSGRYEADADETVEVDEKTSAVLIKAGIAEPAETKGKKK